jgi:hypothetical protein
MANPLITPTMRVLPPLRHRIVHQKSQMLGISNHPYGRIIHIKIPTNYKAGYWARMVEMAISAAFIDFSEGQQQLYPLVAFLIK